jgi:hypothetical protein
VVPASLTSFSFCIKFAWPSCIDIETFYVVHLLHYNNLKPIAVAVLSKAWVCGCSLAEIVGSNLAGGMDVCLL